MQQLPKSPAALFSENFFAFMLLPGFLLAICYWLVFMNFYYDAINDWLSGGFVLRTLPLETLSGEVIFSSENWKGLEKISLIRDKKRNDFAISQMHAKFRDYALSRDLKIVTPSSKRAHSLSFVDILGYVSVENYYARLTSFWDERSKIEIGGDSSISPDGEMISFIAYKHTEKELKGGFMQDVYHPASLYILKTNNSELVAVIKDVHRKSKISWSPDSKRIIFTMADEFLYIYDIHLKNTITKIAKGWAGKWSSDGEEIIYISGNHHFLVLCTPSGKINNVIRGNNVLNMTFSPDRRYVVYVRQSWHQLGLERKVTLEVSTRNGSAKNTIQQQTSGIGFSMNSLFLRGFLSWIKN